MNLLTSTLERRRRLATLWFVCQCTRCTGPDLARRMRCPRCGAASGCLPSYIEGGCSAKGLDRISLGSLPDATRWRCTSCSAMSTSAEMPLREESDLARLVPEAMMRGGSASSSGNEARLFLQLRARAARTLGPEHWTYALAGFAFLQRSLAQLRHDPVILQCEEDFQEVSREVAQWLKVTAPHNAEQRMSALFATVRLEHNLGGGLAVWGYDPADPLGNDLCALDRIKQHGWRLSADGSVRGPEDDVGSDDIAGSRGRRPKSASGAPRPAPPGHREAHALFCDGGGWR